MHIFLGALRVKGNFELTPLMYLYPCMAVIVDFFMGRKTLLEQEEEV